MRRPLVFLLSCILLAGSAVPASAQSSPAPARHDPAPDLTDAERRSLAGMVLRSLEAAYAGDPAPLAAIAAPEAIAGLRATDWRAAETADGERRYLAELHAGAVSEMEPVYSADGVIKESLELRIDAAPGATLVDRDDRVVEVATGGSWWTLAVTFERDVVGAPWRITAMGPATDLEPDFTPLPEAPPCPWDPATRRSAAGDPFLLGPWCDVNGRGRTVLERDDLPRGQAGAISVIAGPAHCEWEDLRFLTLGWPAGAPIDRWNAGRYVRDPGGEVSHRGFQADTELPDDAVSTGITNGRATIWMSDTTGRRAVFLQVDGRVERWPRTQALCY